MSEAKIYKKKSLSTFYFRSFILLSRMRDLVHFSFQQEATSCRSSSRDIKILSNATDKYRARVHYEVALVTRV